MRSCTPLCRMAFVLSFLCFSAATLLAQDLRRAVPNESYMVVYGKHNPERDYQRVYYDEVWKTVEQTQIIDRFIKIVTSQAPQNELDQAKAVIDEIKQAAEPIDFKAIGSAKEVVYAQQMQTYTSHHLVLIRMTPEAAASSAKGVANVLRLIEKYSQGKVPVATFQEGEAEFTKLELPPQANQTLLAGAVGDVFILATSEPYARKSVSMLTGKSKEPSKFDDPRLKEGLSHLPKAEDSVVFYDGKAQFAELGKLPQFILQVIGRQAGEIKPDEEEKAKRALGILETLLDGMSIIDYTVSVEYTEGNQNRSSTYGKLIPGYQQKMLGKAFGSGKPFEQWDRWVPAEATSFSLWTGVNLHPVYEELMKIINERVPEAKPGLDQFEQIQEQIGVHLDRDLLQAFTGECVSITMPPATPSPFGGGADSVTFIRCSKPDRIKELIHRGVDLLKEIPALQAQQISLQSVAELEGFEKISAMALAMFGAQPVIGFRDGWMILGSSQAAVKKVLDTRAGTGSTFASTDRFKKFDLKVDGPVAAASYSNTGESIRQAAQGINQVGMMAPGMIAMAGAQLDPKAQSMIQDVLGLLPAVAQIVAKFDFLDSTMSVIQGIDENSYIQHSVVLIRPAK